MAGFSITTQAVDVRRAIGYVPQAVSVDGSLTGNKSSKQFSEHDTTGLFQAEQAANWPGCGHWSGNATDQASQPYKNQWFTASLSHQPLYSPLASPVDLHKICEKISSDD